MKLSIITEENDQMDRFKIENLSKEQKALRRRILEVSYKASYSHIGSCLSSVDLIEAVYKQKKRDEIFVLSSGHAGIALYAVLEKYGLMKKGILETLHSHPDRNPKLNIHVSTGSLGQGFAIALGLALSDRKKNVYCLISDGECAEGSIWESLRISSEIKLTNLIIIVNVNGWGAYGPVDTQNLFKRIKAFGCHIVKADGHDLRSLIKSLRIREENKPLVIFAYTTVEQLPFLEGLHAHYYVMKEENFKQVCQLLK